jgi:Restriction endonuclease
MDDKEKAPIPTAMEKGDALHKAVLSIEHAILKNAPGLSEKTFVIDEKKIIRVNDVRHEVDIYVTVDPAPGYASIYIFECKNWANPVGKNEIVAFSEKIRVLSAAHGYFVAKSFTADARAQARLDERLTLLLAAEHDFTGLAVPNVFNMHSISAVGKRIDTQIKKRDSTSEQIKHLNLPDVNVMYRGAKLEFLSFIREWANKSIQDDTLKIRTEKLEQGVYERTVKSVTDFPNCDFILNGLDIGSITIVVDYHLHVFHPPIVSRFDVETRGRSWSYSPFVLPEGGTVVMRVIERPGVLGDAPRSP